MIFHYSGGSSIIETTLQQPGIMLSYFVDGKKDKPSARLRSVMQMRVDSRKPKKKGKKK